METEEEQEIVHAEDGSEEVSEEEGVAVNNYYVDYEEMSLNKITEPSERLIETLQASSKVSPIKMAKSGFTNTDFDLSYLNKDFNATPSAINNKSH
jgi:hypothetical protein